VPAAPVKRCEHDQPKLSTSSADGVLAKPTTDAKRIQTPSEPTPPAPPSAQPSGSAQTSTRSDNPFIHVDSAKPRRVGLDKFRGRRSTSYIDWASLMHRSMNVDVLQCPKCQDRMKPIADITDREVISKIMTHLRLPLVPKVLGDGAVVYDVTGEPVLDPDWRRNQSATERGPPPEWDCVDPVLAPSAIRSSRRYAVVMMQATEHRDGDNGAAFGERPALP
jgi:hypothetical protein